MQTLVRVSSVGSVINSLWCSVWPKYKLSPIICQFFLSKWDIEPRNFNEVASWHLVYMYIMYCMSPETRYSWINYLDQCIAKKVLQVYTMDTCFIF